MLSLLNSKSGTYKSNELTSSTNLYASTGKTFCTLSLEAGTWVISGQLNVSLNNAVPIGVSISKSHNTVDSKSGTRITPDVGVTNYIEVDKILKLTETTSIYLTAYSTSAGTVEYGRLEAVKTI